MAAKVIKHRGQNKHLNFRIDDEALPKGLHDRLIRWGLFMYVKEHGAKTGKTHFHGIYSSWH